MQPIIFHLDMNSYFASVHQQDHPETRDRPVGVCEHLGGIIIAASVDAKRWGIKTGTPVWEARKLYPKIILAPTAPDRYRFFTRKFLKLMGEYSGLVEPYSIDEAFMDGTKACNISRSADQQIGRSAFVDPFEEAVNIALEIKRRMKTEVGDYLTCSIGIAENKLLAKIGSDLKKPDGVVVIKPSSCVIPSAAEESLIATTAVKGFLAQSAGARNDTSRVLIISKEDLYHRLKLIDIPGIGKRQEKNLKELGIKTLAELRDYPQSHLVARFGKIGGYHLYNMGQLKSTWKAPVHRETEIKSIGHMYTLPQKYRAMEFFMPVLYKLCEMVSRRMRKKELMGNIIHFYVYPNTNYYERHKMARADKNLLATEVLSTDGKIGAGVHDKNYEGFGKSVKLGYCISDGREIFLEAARILNSRDGSRPVPTLEGFKLIGITIAGLHPFVNQLSIFGDAERQRRVTSALDKINNKYGDFTVCRVPVLAAKDVFQDSVGFGRVKEL